MSPVFWRYDPNLPDREDREQHRATRIRPNRAAWFQFSMALVQLGCLTVDLIIGVSVAYLLLPLGGLVVVGMVLALSPDLYFERVAR